MSETKTFHNIIGGEVQASSLRPVCTTRSWRR
jgi:hypothetical protein